MMQGHNRPPFAPTIPGTNLRSHDVPTAIIYRPARAAATSAPRSRHWVLEFEPSRPQNLEPLMGWTTSPPTVRIVVTPTKQPKWGKRRQPWHNTVQNANKPY